MAAIYLASRYSRRLEMVGYAVELHKLGHEIVSTWIDGHHETRPNIDADATESERADWAAEDVLDILRADVILSFTEPPRTVTGSRGGRHVEFGIGLATQKLMLVVGPREHVFHCLPDVHVFPDWNAALAYMNRRVK